MRRGRPSRLREQAVHTSAESVLKNTSCGEGHLLKHTVKKEKQDTIKEKMKNMRTKGNIQQNTQTFMVVHISVVVIYTPVFVLHLS